MPFIWGSQRRNQDAFHRLMDRSYPAITAFLVDAKLEKRAKQPVAPEALALMENPKGEQKWFVLFVEISFIQFNYELWLLLDNKLLPNKLKIHCCSYFACFLKMSFCCWTLHFHDFSLKHLLHLRGIFRKQVKLLQQWIFSSSGNNLLFNDNHNS